MTYDIALSTVLWILAFAYMCSLLLLIAISSICLAVVSPPNKSVDVFAYKWQVKLVQDNFDRIRVWQVNTDR